MFIDHLAWLHAVPELKDKERRRISRLAECEKYNIPYDVPAIQTGQYIIDWFMLAGMVGQGSGGAVPLCWMEVRAFSKQMNLNLNPWESSLIMRLSRVYASGLARYTDAEAEPPYIEDEEKYEQAQAEKRAFLRAEKFETQKK